MPRICNNTATVRDVREKLEQLSGELRRCMNDMEDPKARAMFDTSAAVIDGLKQAFQRYESVEENVWQE